MYVAPFLPVRGLSTSHITVIFASKTSLRKPDKSILRTKASSRPQPESSLPSASRNLTPRAAAAPIPPSLVAEPPIPIKIFLIPSFNAEAISSPVPLLVAASGSNAFSSINASPDAFAISITAVAPAVFSPNEVRTPYSAAIFLPSGAVTFTERIFPLKARVSVSAVPSPPSAIGSVLTLHPGRYCRAAFLIIVQTLCASMLPLNLSGAISIRIPAPTGSIRLPPYSSKGFTTGFPVFLQPHSAKSFSLKTRVPFSSNLP